MVTKEKLFKVFTPTDWFRMRFIYHIFLEKDDSDIRAIQRLKDNILNKQHLEEIEDISKDYYNGEEAVNIILLKNGEWFEMGAKLWTSNYKILGNSLDNKEAFKKYID